MNTVSDQLGQVSGIDTHNRFDALSKVGEETKPQ